MSATNIHGQVKEDRGLALDNYNELIRLVQCLARTVYSERDFSVNDFGTHKEIALREENEDESDWSFGLYLNENTLTVYAGYIHFMGPAGSDYSVSETDLTLSGTDAYVYVYHAKDHSASGISFTSTLPNSTGANWVFPIAKLTSSGGTTYTISKRYHKGDFYVMLPLM